MWLCHANVCEPMQVGSWSTNDVADFVALVSSSDASLAITVSSKYKQCSALTLPRPAQTPGVKLHPQQRPASILITTLVLQTALSH